MAPGGPNAAARRATTVEQLPGLTATERKIKKQKKAQRRMARNARASGNAKDNKKQANELLAKIQRLESAAKNSWTKAQKHRALYHTLMQKETKEDGTANPETLRAEQLFTIDTAPPPWVKQAKNGKTEALHEFDGSAPNKRKRDDEEDNEPDNETTEENTAKKERKRRRKAKTDESAEGEDVAAGTEDAILKDIVAHTDTRGTPKTAEETEELEAQSKVKKISKEKKKKKDKKDKKDTAEPEVAKVEETITEEPPIADPSTEVRETKNKKKAKKDRPAKEETDETAVVKDTVEATTEVNKKNRKGKKCKKDKLAEEEVAKGDTTMTLVDEAAAASQEQEDQEPSPEQAPKDKSPKKCKRSKKAESAAATVSDKEVDGTEELERWNVQGLEGGEARQSKYLRLLGGKKAGLDEKKISAAKSSSSSSRKRLDAKAIEEDLKKQFEAGMKTKHEGGGKKRGLGA